MFGENRLTVWGNPREIVNVTIGNKIINSGYGAVTYKVWCDLEVKRMKKNGVCARVIANESGQICISK